MDDEKLIFLSEIGRLNKTIRVLREALEQVGACFNFLEIETDQEVLKETTDPLTLEWIHSHAKEEREKIEEALQLTAGEK